MKNTMPGKVKNNVWQIVKSVLAGAIGIQSEANRKKDFESDSFWPFIVGGVVFTILFVVVLVGLVLLVS